MKNKEFGAALEKRTKQFAVSIIKISVLLPRNAVGQVIQYQIVKSGTSIGANYREANRAVSVLDFKNKISICEKELSETQYWFEIIEETKLLNLEKTESIYRECIELLKLFTAIGKGVNNK